MAIYQANGRTWLWARSSVAKVGACQVISSISGRTHIALIALVGSRMDAESAVRIRFGLPFRVKFIREKGFGILDDFLSLDSGQPLSGWFSLKSILPKRGSAFYIIWVIFGFRHDRKPLQLLLFWSFAHGWGAIFKGDEEWWRLKGIFFVSMWFLYSWFYSGNQASNLRR